MICLNKAQEAIHPRAVSRLIGPGKKMSIKILQARAANLLEAQLKIAPVELTIRQRLGSLVFGVEDEELQDAVIGLLKERSQTVATAESVTAGPRRPGEGRERRGARRGGRHDALRRPRP